MTGTGAELARDFITFCDGLEEAGLVDYARRGRTIARELSEALDALAVERSARRAIQGQRDRLQEIIGKGAYYAAIAAAAHEAQRTIVAKRHLAEASRL